MTVADKNLELHNKASILAGFVLQGSSLRAWCIANDVQPQNAHKALSGTWRGPKATELVHRIRTASGIGD